MIAEGQNLFLYLFLVEKNIKWYCKQKFIVDKKY